VKFCTFAQLKFKIPAMLKKNFLFFAVSCLLSISLTAQVTKSNESVPFCSTDEMHQRLFHEHPQYNEGIIRANQRLKTFTEDYALNSTNRVDGVYIIPVVFHIIHNNGNENISDAQIHDAIRQANLQFRKRNSDTTEIVSAFQSLAADCEIELRLAQLDPEGNCTSGITRTVSTLGSIGDHQVKSLIQWPPNKYLNVYICSQAAGLAGHALLPSAADTIPQWDGIVMQHSYIGTFGTSDYFRRTVLTHEIGHYLNLQHIWGGNNVPNYYYLPVAQAVNCNHDDEVEDTPLTIGWQSCNLNGNSCGSLDNVQNYMDYAYCARMFTEGQKTRMHACLNSPVAGRNNLWTEQNLIETGTDDITFYLCAAKFEANKRVACINEVITLTDLSYHGIQTRQWIINGAVISNPTDSVTTITFSEPGVYTVQLKVARGLEEVELTETNYIHILPASGTLDALHEGFENQFDYEERWVNLPNNSPVHFERINDTGYKSESSLFLNNFDASLSTVYEFISHPFDASGLSAIAISFDWAYAAKPGTNPEILQVAVSNNCGETWSVRKTYSGSSILRSVPDPMITAFTPADTNEWNSDVITTIPSTFLTSNLQFKFKFDSKAGNNLFIDNIRIGHPESLNTSLLLKEGLRVFPNPSKDFVQIQKDEALEWKEILIFDLLGKNVLQQSLTGISSLDLDISSLQVGTYLIQIETNVGKFTFRHVKE
jgi:PKD repeat protein